MAIRYVFDNSLKSELSDGVRFTDIDVEWRDCDFGAHILISYDEKPMLAFLRQTDETKKYAGVFSKLKDALVSHSSNEGFEVVIITESQTHTSVNADTIKTLMSSIANMSFFQGMTTEAKTSSPQDSVMLVSILGSKVKNAMHVLNCSPKDCFMNISKAKTLTAYQGKQSAFAFIRRVPGFTQQCAECVLAEFQNLANIVLYYHDNPIAGQGDEEAVDRIARIRVNNRRIGEIDSKSLRDALFGNFYEENDGDYDVCA